MTENVMPLPTQADKVRDWRRRTGRTGSVLVPLHLVTAAIETATPDVAEQLRAVLRHPSGRAR